jgi:hypothetical protein
MSATERLHAALLLFNSIQQQLGHMSLDQWQQCLDIVRRDLAVLSEVDFFGDDYPETLQINVLFTLQRIAYHHQDLGGASDIGVWCLDRWLELLAEDQQNVQILRGQCNPNS